MITASVYYDLSDAERDHMGRRLSTLNEVPAGVRVIVNVGALAPEPSAARILAHYEKRLHIDVHGTAYAVRRWYRAIMETTSEALL